MFKLFVPAVLAFGLFACVSDGGSPYTETAAICDTAGLESQLVSLRDQSKSTRLGLSGAGVGAAGAAGGAGAVYSRDKTDVQRVYQLRDRLHSFEAEVDALYRSATARCRTYARCMERRGYNQNRCWALEQSWSESEQRIPDLRISLAEIEADVEKFRLATRPGPRRGYPRRRRVNPNECPCPNSVGGVFSNGCC